MHLHRKPFSSLFINKSLFLSISHVKYFLIMPTNSIERIRLMGTAAAQGGAAAVRAFVYWLSTYVEVFSSGGLVDDRAIGISYFTEQDFLTTTHEMIENEVGSLNRNRCYEAYRMDANVLYRLCDILSPSVHVTEKLTLLVQVTIYLDWVAPYPTIRKQKRHFKLSHDSIETARRNVRRAILVEIYPRYVKLASYIPDLTHYHKRRFFQGAYGCLDGCHLPIEVRVEEKEDWLNRKGFVSTNAMLICDIEDSLIFQYAMFGAEGPGPDSTIFRYCCARDLKFLPHGYLLGDAGYGLSRHILTPYRGVRYHLKEFGANAQGRPRNKEELFNLRHSSTRNQIERAFGVLKKEISFVS